MFVEYVPVTIGETTFLERTRLETETGPRMRILLTVGWEMIEHEFPAKQFQKSSRLLTYQSGPKGTKMVNLSVLDHLSPSGPFWTISEND